MNVRGGRGLECKGRKRSRVEEMKGSRMQGEKGVKSGGDEGVTNVRGERGQEWRR